MSVSSLQDYLGNTYLQKFISWLRSSIVIEGVRTKLIIFLNCVLRKQKERIKPAFYQDVLVFFTFKDIKMICVSTPY